MDLAASELTQRAIDEITIRNIIAKSAVLQDSGFMQEYTELFVEDGIWELRGPPRVPALFPAKMQGRDTMLSVLNKLAASNFIGPTSHRYHVKILTAIDVEGDTASSTTYGTSCVTKDGKSEMGAMLIYRDTFLRRADGWKIVTRYVDPT
jgi:hypothetical protein